MLKKKIWVIASVLLICGIAAGCINSKKEPVRVEIQQVNKQSEGVKETTSNPQKTETIVTRNDIGKRDGLINVEWKAPAFEKKVPEYKIKADLSNVVNIEQFGTFTKEQKTLLVKNGFVVLPTNEEQLFYIYERNEYLKIPSFISTDSVLQVYHLFFDYSLRKVEEQKLTPVLGQLTSNMLLESIKQYKNIKNPFVKEAAAKNVAYFAVAQKLLGKSLPKNMPQNAAKLAEEELLLISRNESFTDSNIFPYKVDYSQFAPRGHYTKNETLKKYFKAMMWYGLISFPIDDKQEYKQQVIQGLLMTQAVFSSKENESLWEKIYDPTSLYVGAADDITIHHFKDMLAEVYGKNPNLEELDNTKKVSEFYKLAKALPEPKIKAKVDTGRINIPVGKQFKFMGQRYIADSEVLQELTDIKKRPMPKGLDVMAVFGSERAKNILNNQYKEKDNWNKYSEIFDNLEAKFSAASDETWRSNIYYGWLWTLKSLLASFEEGYPSFMRNTAWQDKSLSTALSSWSELRHDTVLYGKQSMTAECGGFEEPPPPKGYVEPNIEMYQRLKWLTEYTKTNLKNKDIMTGEVESGMENFANLLDFLITCSTKELKNEELTQEEYYSIRIYGGTLEGLTLSCTDVEKWYQIESETEKNIAMITDIHTYNDQYLEAGIGNADEIYTIVPIKGKLYLTRGAVFSYYEFKNNKRLTDEEWLKIIKNGKPNQQEWIKSFKNQKGIHHVPVPAEPFVSGC
ncbi:MAG: DUF3160 domain-containing protein [Deltaproteobacteria bacterium]